MLSQPLEVGSDLDSSVSVFEEASPSFPEALDAVYKYLPQEVCPTQPDPVPRARSLWEVDKALAPRDMLKLPHSPTVAALLGDLQRAQGFDTKKVGCLTPKTFLAHMGLKFYAPHTEAWPLKHPSLDEDAQKIGVSKASFPKAPDALLESLDVRARSLVSMASHMDLFLGAAKPAIESEDSRAVAALSAVVCKSR